MLDTGKTQRRSRTSHAQVVDELGRAIVAGTYPVGTILPGDVELAQRFKVSRTVLRETMKTLAAKGMIVAKARVGTRVTEKSQWNMFDSEVIAWHFDDDVTEEFLLRSSLSRQVWRPSGRRPTRLRCSPDWPARWPRPVTRRKVWRWPICSFIWRLPMRRTIRSCTRSAA
jgi:DNA-binding transcriptional regulator YhcF (GntR family)